MQTRLKHFLRNLIVPLFNPIHAITGLKGYIPFLLDWYRYNRLPGAEPVYWLNIYPQLHDRSLTSAIDSHYFFVNGWAMRRVVSTSPKFHIDVASQTIFANLLGAVTPVVYFDYRPLVAKLTNLTSLGGNLLQLPFADKSISSISCLHVVEHVGLGRYGDPLNPRGTHHAIRELSRTLALEGNLFLAAPVGRQRVCFNAHRIHSAKQICQMADELQLVEFSGIDDAGNYLENINLSALDRCDYGCGLFWFRRVNF